MRHDALRASALADAVPDGGGTSIARQKEAVLLSILSRISFNQASRARQPVLPLTVRAQAIVFSNNRVWIEAVAKRLSARGFPAAFTCGASRAALGRDRK